MNNISYFREMSYKFSLRRIDILFFEYLSRYGCR